MEVETRLAEDFGIDNMGMGLGLRTLPEALGCKLKYSQNNVSYIEKPAIESYGELEGRALPDITKDGRLPILVEAFDRLADRFMKKRSFLPEWRDPLRRQSAWWEQNGFYGTASGKRTRSGNCFVIVQTV